MLEVFFNNVVNDNSKPFEKIANQLIKNAVRILDCQENNLTLAIHIVSDEEALKLNQQYRGKNYIPDVLSFPTKLSQKEINTIGLHELGDIIISLDEAQRKANRYHHSLEIEFAFLVVHGFLHLYGFDHENSLEEEAEMFKWQEQILASANYKYEIKDF